MKFLILFLLLSTANASEWKRFGKNFNYLGGEITYLNRAACAERGKFPTQSVFLIVDNVNFAKAAYRLSKIKNLDPVTTTNFAIEKFRYTLTSLIGLISSRLLSNDLPFVEDHLLGYEYLKTNWERSSGEKPLIKSQCKMVRKLSTLFSHLNVSKPDHELFEKMAKDMENLEETYTDCENFEVNESPETAFYQFDLLVDRNFKKYGFKFWYSLKIYLSWAFRYSPEVVRLSAPFDQLIRSVNLEEMILFFSNGCESIVPSECSDFDLNLNNLKTLTKYSKDLNLSQTDFLRPTPESPVSYLLSQPLPLMEDDLLNLKETPTTKIWVENFRENFLKVRGQQKMRLSRAFSNLSLITRFISEDLFMRKIHKELVEGHYTAQEVYYMCSEFGVSSKNHLSHLRIDLNQLKENLSIKEAFHEMFETDYESIFGLFQNLKGSIKAFCTDLQNQQFWKDVEVKKEGFSSWYKDFIYEEEKISFDYALTTQTQTPKPFLKVLNGEVICYNGVHCARVLLDSIMTLSAISKSLSAVYTQSDIISSNMANPYASSMACGNYDPWAKKNKIIFDFFHDLTQAGMAGLLPTPVYVSADLQDKKVTSFTSLMREGKVFYDPQFDPKKLKLSLMTDLGPLIGVPCAISVSGTKLNPHEYYTFDGISLSGCRESSKIDLDVSEDDLQKKTPKYNKSCLSCALNLRTLSSVLGAPPILRSSAFLVKGVVRLIQNLKDKNDLFKSWKVSPQKLLLSFRYHGGISPKCAKLLLKGESCIPKKCESRMLEELTKKFKVSPVSSDFSCLDKTGYVVVKECPEPLEVIFHQDLKISSSCLLSER